MKPDEESVRGCQSTKQRS